LRQSHKTPARTYAKGIGDAVADRTYNRLVDPENTGTSRRETWAEVGHRVAAGNSALHTEDCPREFHNLSHHLRQASTLMSGRHLQHGDDNQPERNQEVFTNCSTAASTFLSFYLLMNGSGVGRAYDDCLMKVDYRDMPIVVPVCKEAHADVVSGEIKALTHMGALQQHMDKISHYFRVPDSREGWAKAIERIEAMTYEKRCRSHVLILDFSDVRPRNSPIKGMQNRPASGPAPLIEAIKKIATLRDAGMPAWKSTMHADHYVSECVLVGGARRSARMSTKTWRDRSVLNFITVKQGGQLWSSNNSVTVDAEFWRYVNTEDTSKLPLLEWSDCSHAKRVFRAICEASYHDGTGEPGFINQHKLTQNDEGIDLFYADNYAGSKRYQLDEDSKELMFDIASTYSQMPYKMITNPCGEIALSMMGGYCIIADVVPYHAGTVSEHEYLTEGTMQEWDEDALDAFRTVTRALIRVNKMDSLYSKEVQRTNRIGVGMTGIHEYAWSRFGYAWADLVDEERSKPFWLMLAKFKRAVQDEAVDYSAKLGMVSPHTDTTMKPSGSISKLFGLTEGAHLPSMREYIRWVQFRSDDPLIADYRAKGYPVRELKTYKDHTIVGFPTQPLICTLGMGDKLVTAAEATPEDQYKWLMLLEKYWITGVQEDGTTALRETGNQVSYTLKYNPEVVSFEQFMEVTKKYQPHVRCCSVMPQTNTTAYEYVPEQGVTKAEFDAISQAVIDEMAEDIGKEHLGCEGGACPIDFKEKVAA